MALIEGSERGTFMVDAQKITCDYCQGTEFQVSTLMDDPIDIVDDEDFAALMIVAAGSPIMGLVGMCSGCGHLKILLWYLFDVGAATAVGNVLQMTNLDTNRNPGSGANATADLLAGLYCIYLDAAGDDTGDYFVIDTNDASTAVEIILTVAPTDNDDGFWMITNILPLGITLHS